jgi:hypothetical protein
MIYIHSMGRAGRYYPERPARSSSIFGSSMDASRDWPLRSAGAGSDLATVWRCFFQTDPSTRVGLCVQLDRRDCRSDQYATFNC